MGRTPGPRALRAAALFVPGILGVGAAALPERVAGPQAAGAAAADGTALTWPKRDEKPGLVVEEDTSVPDLPEVDTGFRPERDFYDFTNGDYKTDGWCLGMALLATWYYDQRLDPRSGRPEMPPLADLLRLRSGPVGELDLIAREMGEKAQLDTYKLEDEQRPARDEYTRRANVRQTQTGQELIAALQATHRPQVLIFRGIGGDGIGYGHAVVAYAFQHGEFLIADPNYPGVTVELPFSAGSGFGGFVTPGGVYPRVTTFGFTSFASFPHIDFAEIMARSILDGGDKGRYPTIRLDGATPDGHIAVPSGAEELWLVGTVTDGDGSDGIAPLASSNTVRVYIEGQPVDLPATLDGGHIEARIPAAVLAAARSDSVRVSLVLQGDRSDFGGGLTVTVVLPKGGDLSTSRGTEPPPGPSATPGFLGVLGR